MYFVVTLKLKIIRTCHGWDEQTGSSCDSWVRIHVIE